MDLSMENISIVPHKGKTIVVLDFSGAPYVEVLQRIGRMKAFVSTRSKSSLLLLTDVSGCEINKRTVDAFKEFALHNKTYAIASAVFGLSGFPRIFVSAVNQFSKRDIRLFNNSTAAKDWLVGRH
jgi:hypothetical protein